MRGIQIGYTRLCEMHRRGKHLRKLSVRGGALLLAAMLIASNAAAEPIELRLRAIALDTEAPNETRVGHLEYMAGYVLSSGHPSFGGYSGLVLSATGDRFVAISDRGHWLTGAIERDVKGRLTGLNDVAIAPLRDLGGRPVLIRDALHDAEAIERLADGSFIVSFERRHRLWRYPKAAPSTSARAKPFIAFDALRRLPINGGIEAAAPLADGSVLLISEEGYQASGDLKGWLWRQGRAQALSYATHGAFKPTDLAVFRNGDVLALERRFSPVGNAAARLVRIAHASIRPGARLQGEELARLAWPLVVDNFEGLAISEISGQGTVVYLLSDDNFNPLQDTMLLQFRLDE